MDIKTIKPDIETIEEVKKSFTRLCKRRAEAEKYLNNSKVCESEKNKYMAAYIIEIHKPLNEYYSLLQLWKVDISENELWNGFE